MLLVAIVATEWYLGNRSLNNPSILPGKGRSQDVLTLQNYLEERYKIDV